MATQVLRPNHVQEAGSAGIVVDFPPATSTPTFVGDQDTLWRDDNPATYANLITQITSVSSPGSITITREDEAVAPLDTLTVDSATATLNSVRIEWSVADLTTDYPGGTPIAALLNLVDSTTHDSFYGYTSRWNQLGLINPSNPSPEDSTYLPGDWAGGFAHPATGVAFTSAEVLDFFASGNVMVMCQVGGGGFTTGNWGFSGKVLDVKVTIDYTPTFVLPPPMRRYPPINNGGSGPTRHYPRAVNRRAGGTY